MANKVVWHGARVMAEIGKQTNAIVAKAALEVRKEAQDSMERPKTGRTYRLPLSKATYRASAKGEAPAARLGTLKASVLAHAVAAGRWRIESNLDYALGLEMGTRKVKARPFLRPALDKVAAAYRGKAKL